MTADDHQAMITRAREALRWYDKIGEGDWTPQDVYGQRCAEDVLSLVAALAALTQQLQDREKALRWYAENDGEPTTIWVTVGPPGAPKRVRMGDIARAALAATGTGEREAPSPFHAHLGDDDLAIMQEERTELATVDGWIIAREKRSHLLMVPWACLWNDLVAWVSRG